jgi:hypothetical protein
MEGRGFCRNCKLRVCDLLGAQHSHFLKVYKVNDSSRKKYLLPRINFENIKPDFHSSANFKRVQFPLELAYAYSINKSQGGTLYRALLDVSQSPVFAHGQLFVAMSRVRKSKDFAMYCIGPRDGLQNGEVHGLSMNVVFHQLLVGAKNPVHSQPHLEPAVSEAGASTSGEHKQRRYDRSETFQQQDSVNTGLGRVSDPLGFAVLGNGDVPWRQRKKRF